MKKSSLFISMGILSAVSFSHAEYISSSQAPLSMVQQNAVFRIKKNGSTVVQVEEHLRVNNDQGRVDGAIKKIPYLRRNNNVRIEWAKTIFNNREYMVAPAQILDHVAAGPQNGISNFREKVISFNNIFVGSEIQYKYTVTEKKPMIPGIFGMVFSYGLEMPEMNEVNKIISEVPIYYRVQDPKGYLDVKESTENGQHVLTVLLKKNIFHMPSKDEILPLIDPQTIPTVAVSINKNWAQVNSMFAAGFEKVLSQPLPKEYTEIVQKAQKEKDEFQKINVVTSELARQMTYAGDWKNSEDMFFPKNLKKISALKTGDCKDFATATAGILRKMGIKASVALVQRMLPLNPGYLMARQNFPNEEPIVNMQTWNHAIVKVTLSNQKDIWVDPTNPVSFAGYVKEDIKDSPALVLSPDSKHLETVTSLQTDSVAVLHRKVKIRGDETAELTATLDTRGVTDVQFLELFWEKGAEAAEKVYGQLMGFGQKSLTEEIQMPKEKSRISKPTTIQMTAAIPSPIKEVHKEENGKKVSKLVFEMGLPPQLRIFRLANEKRVSHMAIGQPDDSFSENQILGYHVKDVSQADCLIYSPWIQIERAIENTAEGFVVHFHFHQMASYIMKEQIRSRDFALFEDDLNRCFQTEAFEVEPIPATPVTNVVAKGAPTTVVAKEKIPNEPDLNTAYEVAEGFDHVDLMMARRVLLKEVAKNPKNAKAHAALSNLIVNMGYLSGNDYGSSYVWEGGREADLALQANANVADSHIAKARVLILSNKLDAGKAELTQSYRIDPKNFQFFMLATKVSEMEKKYDVAEKYLLAALPLAKDKDQKIRSYNYLGVIKQDAKMDLDAIKYYQQGLQVDPKNDWLLGNCMNAYMDLEKWDEAIELGKKAMEISEHNIYRHVLANAYAHKGLAILNSGELKPAQELEAEKLFQSSLKLKADQPNGIRGLGILYFHMGKKQKDRILLTQAKQYLERSFKHNPTDPYTIHNLIAVREALGLSGGVRMPAGDMKSGP